MLSITGSPKALRLLQTAAALFVLFWFVRQYFFSHSDGRHSPIGPPSIHDKSRPPHPIDDLHNRAKAQVADLIANQALTLEAAERDYIKLRGRRPPPGFDKWFRYAQEHDAVIVEGFFDRIYDDLNPFWAVAPIDIRRPAREWYHRISIRNGNVTQHTDEDRPWLNLWADLIQYIGHLLPDLDLAMNEMDESRMVVPWETINEHMQKEATTRHVAAKSELVPEIQCHHYSGRRNSVKN